MRDNLPSGKTAYLNVGTPILLGAGIGSVAVNLDVLDTDPAEASSSDYGACIVSGRDLDRAPRIVGWVPLSRYLLVLGSESYLAGNLNKRTGAKLDYGSGASSRQSTVDGILVTRADTSSRGEGYKSGQRQRSLA